MRLFLSECNEIALSIQAAKVFVSEAFKNNMDIYTCDASIIWAYQEFMERNSFMDISNIFVGDPNDLSKFISLRSLERYYSNDENKNILNYCDVVDLYFSEKILLQKDDVTYSTDDFLDWLNNNDNSEWFDYSNVFEEEKGEDPSNFYNDEKSY